MFQIKLLIHFVMIMLLNYISLCFFGHIVNFTFFIPFFHSKRNRRGSRRGNRVRGRGRGRGRKKPVEKSADELDKELENYHAGAMST